MADESTDHIIIGGRFELVDLIAVEGVEGCQSWECTRIDGRCVGYHCAHCGKPSSHQGHALRHGGFSCERAAGSVT